MLASAKRQVLIEATVAEVQLNNQYQHGIDWSAACPTGGARPDSASLNPATGVTTASPTGSIIVIGAAAPQLTQPARFVRLLESFGNVRVLSSPRLTVLNNQTAILKVVDNQVYFTIQATTMPGTINSLDVTTFTTTPNIVAVGLHHERDAADQRQRQRAAQRAPEHIAHRRQRCRSQSVAGRALRPKQRRRHGLRSDRQQYSDHPDARNGVADQGEQRPDRGDGRADPGPGQRSEDSVPGANRLAGIGRFFENKNVTNTKTELVIFMRAIIIRDASIDGDYRGFRTYLPDDIHLRSPTRAGAPPFDPPQGSPQ